MVRKTGATPALNLEPIEVKPTRENLKTAIAGETYEPDIMYSQFVEVATHEKATAGIRTFTFALKVEAVHAVLYQDALDNLQKRTGKNHTYPCMPGLWQYARGAEYREEPGLRVLRERLDRVQLARRRR